MPVHGSKLCVLVAGHEPALRDTYALILQGCGYIARALALQDLCSTLKDGPVDVVILDHTLSAKERSRRAKRSHACATHPHRGATFER